MSMKNAAVVSGMVAVCTVACVLGAFTGLLTGGTSRTFAAEPERHTGELNGTVVGVEAVKADNGILRLSLTITTEEGAKETFIVGPGNAQAYATVGGLKAGDKVRLAWVTEGGDQKWIKAIRKVEAGAPEHHEGTK